MKRSSLQTRVNKFTKKKVLWDRLLVVSLMLFSLCWKLSKICNASRKMKMWDAAVNKATGTIKNIISKLFYSVHVLKAAFLASLRIRRQCLEGVTDTITSTIAKISLYLTYYCYCCATGLLNYVMTLLGIRWHFV